MLYSWFTLFVQTLSENKIKLRCIYMSESKNNCEKKISMIMPALFATGRAVGYNNDRYISLLKKKEKIVC